MASKRPRATSKIDSSEEKIKGNALYFVQGREFTLEVFDLPSYLERYKELPDGEVVAHLRSLAASQRTPKLGFFTVTGEGEEAIKEHNPIKLEGEGGRYKGVIPDLYKRDGAERYEVCGTIHTKRSFTKGQHDAWEDFREKQELPKVLADISRIRREIRKKIPTDEDIQNKRQQLPDLRKSQRELSKKQSSMFLDLDVSDEQLQHVSERLKLITTRIKDLETEISTHESSNDPLKQASESGPESKELQKLNDKVNVAFLEFLHTLSTEAEGEAHTDDNLDKWLGVAGADDYANAIELVSEGNAYWTSGQAAKPLSREDERKLEHSRVLN